ncbi:MAG: hypothetical protein ACP5NE_03355 [Candidatus Micrarchaeia archaeon]
MDVSGEIVSMFIYDCGVKFSEEQLKGLLKNQEEFSHYEYTHPSPEEIATFSEPSIFNLKDIVYDAGQNSEQIRFKVQVSIYVTGIFSIRFRYQFNGPITVMQKLTFDKGIKDFLVAASAKERAKVEKALSRISQISASTINEAYRFYFINTDKRKLAEKDKKMIAGLLIDEQNTDMLSNSYIEEVTKRSIIYNDDDIIYVGWEGAVMVDTENAYEQELTVTEIANAQLLEMRIYYDSISKTITHAESLLPSMLTLSKRGKLKRLNMELGRFYGRTQDMMNTANDTIVGFGEWYLSRLYALYDDAFKLGFWRASLEKQLDILDKRRNFIADVLRSQWDEVLEWIVILLIVVEVVVEVLFLAGVKPL